jgi:hypothetical protein
VFHADSCGYRPGKSAIDAVRQARQRCWRYDWVLDIDVKGYFDSIDWELMFKAVRRHTECASVLLCSDANHMSVLRVGRYMEGIKMRRGILSMLLVGLVMCGTVHAAPRQPACIEIMAACEQAGFVRGDAKAGDGLFVDCVLPILRGTPQRRRASKPLPQIDLRLVADCKVQNPNFGQRVVPPSQAGEPLVQPSPGPATREGTPARERTTPSPQAVEPPLQTNPPPTATTPQVSPTPQTNDGEE